MYRCTTRELEDRAREFQREMKMHTWSAVMILVLLDGRLAWVYGRLRWSALTNPDACRVEAALHPLRQVVGAEGECEACHPEPSGLAVG